MILMKSKKKKTDFHVTNVFSSKLLFKKICIFEYAINETQAFEKDIYGGFPVVLKFTVGRN